MEGDTYPVMVSRLDIFGSMVDELALPSYNAHVPLQVQFMGELGHDLGGPRKEFLRLALHEVFERLTTGPAKARVLDRQQASTYLENKGYYVGGIVIGKFKLSLAQNGRE